MFLGKVRILSDAYLGCDMRRNLVEVSASLGFWKEMAIRIYEVRRTGDLAFIEDRI